MKVFVKWDPLQEEVICVHKKKTNMCDKCKEVKRINNTIGFGIMVQEFEIQD